MRILVEAEVKINEPNTSFHIKRAGKKGKKKLLPRIRRGRSF